jgi:hypothetical protein
MSMGDGDLCFLQLIHNAGLQYHLVGRIKNMHGAVGNIPHTAYVVKYRTNILSGDFSMLNVGGAKK